MSDADIYSAVQRCGRMKRVIFVEMKAASVIWVTQIYIVQYKDVEE